MFYLLTEKEFVTLKNLSLGLTNSQIAIKEQVKKRTIENRVLLLFQITGVKSRTELAILYLKDKSAFIEKKYKYKKIESYFLTNPKLKGEKEVNRIAIACNSSTAYVWVVLKQLREKYPDKVKK